MSEFVKVSENIFELPKEEDMLVPAKYFGTEKLFRELDKGVKQQLSNVACMKGIQGFAIAMPDAHWGYGFPIGCIAAFDLQEGLISPGGIGFDINCGMRLYVTNLKEKEVKTKIRELINYLFSLIPCGVGGKSSFKVNKNGFYDLIEDGVEWCVENGFTEKKELSAIEENGKIKNADKNNVSEKAFKRGLKQIGTLGSGNHYLEIQRIENIFDETTAFKLGLTENNQVAVMIHCGSRGFGHQIATDYLSLFDTKKKDYNVKLKDRQLAALPFQSSEGQQYFKAMACAANYAFVNRQIIGEQVKKAFNRFFSKPDLMLVYDVSHNIGKIEEYKIQGKTSKLLVHRKGATRSFPPKHSELKGKFKKTGQPVIIGGSMETGSYLLKGAENSMNLSFGSTAHGSGRSMSRAKAKKLVKGKKLQQKMLEKGIYVKTASFSGLAEEAGFAYKDINEVVKTVDFLGVSKKVCSLKPIGNIKG